MVRWVFLMFLIGVTALRVANYTPINQRYKNGQMLKIVITLLDTPKSWGWKKTVEYSGITINLPADSNLTIGEVIEIIGTVEVKLIDGKKSIIDLNSANYRILSSERSVRVLIARLRSIVIQRLMSWLSGDTGALAAGILVGGDDFMSNEGVLAFRRAGISHIMAASGYNVTVVSTWVGYALGQYLNRFVVIYIGVVSIILYILLAGGSAAVIRAGLMAIAVQIGKLWGRESDGGWLLVVISLLMILVRPEWFWDIGFQLSVAAMAGMVYLAGKSLWSQTIACQITTLPLILHYFGELSIIAPVTNMLFLWPVPVVMPVLAIAAGIGLVVPVAGKLISLLNWPLLFFMTKGTLLLSSAHWASKTIEQMSWGWVGLYYAIIILLKWKFGKHGYRN